MSDDSLDRLVGTPCGPDKSKGHSVVARDVPDDVRFFGSLVDFEDVSRSELHKFEGIDEFDVAIEPGKLEAAADRASDKRA